MTAVDAAARPHDWSIADRESARHEARRGRRYAYPSLAAARTALVVVDMVPFFVAENPYCRGIVANVARLADGLRDAGGTVAWVLPVRGERTPWAEEFYGSEAAARASGLRQTRARTRPPGAAGCLSWCS